jgi:tripartite-type tricarboxylate transporter receptor subunit TctC
MQRRKFLINSIGLASLLGLPLSSMAQTGWPTKPIRIVVPVPPGGSLDILARAIANGLSPRLHQPVIVENMAGAGSNIAFGHVAKAQPDGYTLLLGWDSLIINPSLYTSVPYTLQQFSPITLAITSPQILLVGPKLPVKNLKEFIEAAKKASGALTLANAGSGSPGHLAGTLLETLTGVKFINVPYKGGAPAVSDLVAGHVDALMVTLPAALQHVRSGRLKALGVTSAKRSTGAPEIPTLAESGVPGYELNSWQGLFAPTGTPPEIIANLNKNIVEVLRERTVKDQLVTQGFEIVGSSPEGLAKELSTLTPRWAKLVQDSGAKVD